MSCQSRDHIRDREKMRELTGDVREGLERLERDLERAREEGEKRRQEAVRS